MIVKVVGSKGTGSFTGLANYLTDERKQHHDKVEDVTFTNCPYSNRLDNIHFIEKAQSINDSEADKTMHIIVSFQEDEKPSKEVLREIEEQLLKSIGLQDHHRLTVSHVNTNNFHFHIAVNRVDPITLERKDPYRSKIKLQKKALELEEKHKLKRDNHGIDAKLAAEIKELSRKSEHKEIKIKKGAKQHDSRKQRIKRDHQSRRDQSRIHQSNNRNTRRGIQTRSINNLPTLPGLNMVYQQPKLSEIKMLLQGNERHNIRFTRSGDRTSDRVRRTGESDHGDAGSRRRDIKNYEAHSGVKSLLSWIKDEAMEEIQEVLQDKKSALKDLHTKLAEYNLEIISRGNGVVIKDKKRKLFVKASDVHRDLSKGKLEKRFGEFKNMAIDIKPKAQFGREKTEFWENYRKETNYNREQKKELIEPIRNKYSKEKEKLSQAYKLQRQKIKTDRKLKGVMKKELYSFHYQKYVKNLQKLREEEQKEKKEVYNKYRQITYKEYLMREAMKGDAKALETLRVTKPPKPREDENTLGSKTNHKLYVSYQPLLTKKGFVVYRLDDKNDQSKIIDKGNHLKITNANDEALLKALEMAKQKYGKQLQITGDDKFKMKVINLVHKHKLDIGFKDPKMQQVLDAAKAQERRGSSQRKSEKVER